MTTAAVERRLRLLYSSAVVRFGRLKRPTLACTTMDNGKHVITLPDGYDDWYTLRVLLHELMHLAMPGELAAFGDWEEAVIERVAEPMLMHHIASRPRAQSWWLKQLRDLRDHK